jgi:hypothetical protein
LEVKYDYSPAVHIGSGTLLSPFARADLLRGSHGWLHHLIKERQLAASSIHIAVSAVRFLYAVTLGRERIDLVTSVPQMRRAIGPADVYARGEVEAISTAPKQPGSRPITPLRAKYIRDLVIRGRSKNTQKAYTRYVCDLDRITSSNGF